MTLMLSEAIWAAQPKLQRTRLRQGGERRDNLSLD